MPDEWLGLVVCGDGAHSAGWIFWTMATLASISRIRLECHLQRRLRSPVGTTILKATVDFSVIGTASVGPVHLDSDHMS